jgi:hypothetical protein
MGGALLVGLVLIVASLVLWNLLRGNDRYRGD